MEYDEGYDVTMGDLWSLEGKLVAINDENGRFMGAGKLERCENSRNGC